LAKGPPVRRLMRILFGFVAAMLAAAVSEVLFALPLSELFSMDKAARIDRLIEMGGLVLSAATHSAIFSAGFAPFAILIAEWQRLCHWTYYVFVGVLIALGGFLAQYASENALNPTILNNYALIAFITTGAVGGLVYWVFSGHNAGRRRPPARIQVVEPAEDDVAGRETDAAPASAQFGEQKPAQARDVKGDAAKAGGTSAKAVEAKAAEAARSATPRPPAAPAGRSGGEAATKPMTSVPTTGPRVAVKPQLKVIGSVPESGGSKPAKA
jgi:hypothetical protein